MNLEKNLKIGALLSFLIVLAASFRVILTAMKGGPFMSLVVESIGLAATIFLFLLLRKQHKIHRLSGSLTKHLANDINDTNKFSGVIESSNKKIASTTSEQSSSTKKSASKAEEIMIGQKDAIGKLKEFSDSIRETADDFQSIKKRSQRMKETTNTILKNNQGIEEFVKTMRQVVKKVEHINNIVFKSNVLAINAAMEASTAGYAGRGFKVIAEEVSKLSNLIGQTADEVSHLTNSGLDNITKISKDNSKAVNEADSTLSDVINCLETATQKANSEVLLMNDIVRSLQEFEKASSDLCGEIKNVESSSNTIASIAAENSKSSVDLSIKNEAIVKNILELLELQTGLKITEVSPTEAYDLMRKMPIIDVRRPDERIGGDVGYIKGSEFATIGDDFDKYLPSLDKNGSYLFICRSGGRSKKAAQQAKMAGIKKVYNVTGGMLRWVKDGLPVTGATDPEIQRKNAA